MHELVVRARGGDRDAFSELAARSLGRLTAVARLILRDEYAAQDAVQETFIEAWRSLPGLREPDRPDYRWHIEILPRVTGTAGFEWATGWHINPVPPEQAAAYLRGQ